jgi:hypothetical protein
MAGHLKDVDAQLKSFYTSLKERDHFHYLGVDGKVILNLVLKKQEQRYRSR